MRPTASTFSVVMLAMTIAMMAALSGVAVRAQSPVQASQTTTRTAMPTETASSYSTGEFMEGQWAGGGGLGILGSTPDGTAFAMNGAFDYFVGDNVSIGPLAQLGFTDDMTQIGLSGQGKYWIPLSGTGGRGKLALQGGLGFVHADFRQDDTSWLIPLGIGYDHTLDSGTVLNATTLVNFTSLRTAGGSEADVMPGLTFGIRF